MAGVEWDANGENLHRGKKAEKLKAKSIDKISWMLCAVTEMLKTVGKLVEIQGWGLERMQAPSKRQTVQSRTPVFCSFDMG